MATSFDLNAVWQQGDAVSKSVAMLLLLMSIASWSIIVIRCWHLWRLRKQARASLQFWHEQEFAQGLALFSKKRADNHFHVLAAESARAVAHHKQHTSDLHGHLPLSDWLSACLRNTLADNQQRLHAGLTILASVGSTAPFVGLFGTVWGIYHALISLGASGQARLDQVAGPVGEALIMTAFGLAVAIPAVLAYNALSRSNKNLMAALNRFAHQLHAYFLMGSAVRAESSKKTGLTHVHDAHDDNELSRVSAGNSAHLKPAKVGTN